MGAYLLHWVHARLKAAESPKQRNALCGLLQVLGLNKFIREGDSAIADPPLRQVREDVEEVRKSVTRANFVLPEPIVVL